MEEEEMRFGIFMENVEKAARWNLEAGSEVFGVTKFTDMHEEEFKTQYLNYRSPNQP